MPDHFLTIESPAEGLYREKGSKFIGYAFPVGSEEEIKKIIVQLKKEHHGARHWCYAYRLGADKKIFRSNDDGEPSGTAGKPILNQLISADLTNILVVVVRYFGGTLLGTSGLITAYKNATSCALQNSKVITSYIKVACSVQFDTEETNEVMRRLKEFDAEIINHIFTDQNEIIFRVRASFTEKLVTLLEKNKTVHCKINE